eukprot:TRINITY_DN10460_c0_g1_i1.p1 TRINITY_DN10460_c0_g1~~TRINITY_DN10460_c0_g1_i1.p1  ORF type:complete len:130 (+),score=29.50 TRINITY_DN10460_c0_g1_i1:66-455(+)
MPNAPSLRRKLLREWQAVRMQIIVPNLCLYRTCLGHLANGERMDALQEQNQGLHNRMGTMEGTISDMQVDINTMKVDINNMKLDINNMKVDINNMKVDINTIKFNMNNMNTMIILMCQHMGIPVEAHQA